MRFVFAAAAFHLVTTLALPIGRRGHWSVAEEQQQQPAGIEVREYSHQSAYTEFSLPSCPFSQSHTAADDSLIFRLQLLPAEDQSDIDVVLNDRHFLVSKEESRSFSTSNLVRVFDTSGNDRLLAFNVTGLPHSVVDLGGTSDGPFQTISLQCSDPQIGFTFVMRPDSQSPRLVRLFSDSASDMIQFHDVDDSYSVVDISTSSEIADDSIDLAEELETLRLLEDEAADIHAEISSRKKAISAKLRQNREKACLKHLIHECGGVVCAARVVAQRICDKVGINVDPAFEFAHGEMEMTQSHIRLGSKSIDQQRLHESHLAQSAHLPLMLTKTASNSAGQSWDFVHSNPLIRALQVIAGILGLTALWALIKSKCASARTRVERAADREERRNRRTYRRAARRAIMRKRWNDLVTAMSCFRVREERPLPDDEEKRVLILQDAFLEQEKEMAEKGDLMEAEIRELRYAQEIVSSLVRVDEHRYELVTPVHDPPPPLVPLPYTPGTRSRASTHTLPSYTSESLPDYTSRISHERRLSGSTIGFTPSASDSEERRPSVHSRSENSGSSLVDISTRPSGETIRTRPSDVHEHLEP